MRRLRARRVAAGLLVAALAILSSGCAVGTDDELAPPPTRTVTATPSQSLAPAPATIPVGDGEVSPTDVVWAQGGVLHVGRRQVDLSPIDIDAFVVVHGGVFVLAAGELWFTDLSRVSGTGQTDVTGIRTSEDSGLLEVVDTRSGHAVAQGYDTRSGKAVREDVDTVSPAERRRGPGRYEIRSAGGTTSVVDTDTGHPVRVAGLPDPFEPGIWTGEAQFQGVGGAGRGRALVSCDLVRHLCVRTSAVTGPDPVVFGTGR